MALVDLDDALLFSKYFLSGEAYWGLYVFSEYSKGYIFTNEDINGYLTSEEYNKNKALTILGSGDHVFNLISHGFNNIDAIDINKLEYYVYELKKCAIMHLSFWDFLNFFDAINKSDIVKMLNYLAQLKKYLPEDVYKYFENVIIELRGDGLLPNLYTFSSRISYIKGNLYLKGEDEYLNLRSGLEKAQVNLHFGDIRKLISRFDGGYDIVLLSNVVDYFGSYDSPLTLEEFKNFMEKILKLLNPDGLIISSIFWLAAHLKDDDYTLFKGSEVTLENLGRDNVRVLPNAFGHGYYRVRKNKEGTLWN